MTTSSQAFEYDLIVIGGALSGSATALLTKHMLPGARILVLERSESFSRRVGESTVEVSSYFLGKVLGLSDYLAKEHLLKQGLRFWFHNKSGKCLDSCSEIGPHYNVRLASFQIDRAKLDEHLLGQCPQAGIQVLRPAEVKDFTLNPGGPQSVTLRTGEKTLTFTSRWIVDASGVAKLIARKSGWVRRNTDHPIATAWARWKGVKSWDSAELRSRFPVFAQRTFALRNTATNHLIGKGWWSWWIPLEGGDVSIGIVYDERLVELPPGEKPIDRLRALLETHPIARILLEDAESIEGDVHWRKNLPYYTEKMVGDGFALVGDAAAFIDPFYSPGMDWISFTAYGAADLIAREQHGMLENGEIEKRNGRYRTSYDRWFKAIYKDKYYYMGDWELMRLAFQLDVGLYYLGVVSQPYKYGSDSFTIPPFSGPHTTFPAWLIRTYNRRLVAIARNRLQRGTWGKRNDHCYLPFKSFGIDRQLVLRVILSLLQWGWLELREGWRSWFR